MAESILTRLRYPRLFVRRVSWLVAKHMRFAPMMIHKNNTLLRWIRSEATGGTFRTEKEMAEAFSQLTEVFLADMGATWAGVLQEPVMAEGRRLGEEAVRIAREKMPVHTSDLQVRGSEVQALLKESLAAQATSSFTVADAMKYLLLRVQNGNVPNKKEALLTVLRTKLKKVINH